MVQKQTQTNETHPRSTFERGDGLLANRYFGIIFFIEADKGVLCKDMKSKIQSPL